MEAMARLHAGSLGRHRWTQSRAREAPRVKASRKLSSRRSAGSQRSPRGWATAASSAMTSARAGGRSESQRPARDEGLERLSLPEARALAAVRVMSSGRSASECARVASEASLHASGSAMPRWANSGSSQNAASPSAAAVSRAAWPRRDRGTLALDPAVERERQERQDAPAQPRGDEAPPHPFFHAAPRAGRERERQEGAGQGEPGAPEHSRQEKIGAGTGKQK